jgi:hypothetical protein
MQRSALHLAQVVQMALRQGPNGPATTPPEAACAQPPESSPDGKTRAALAAGAAIAMGGAALAAQHQRQGRR